MCIYKYRKKLDFMHHTILLLLQLLRPNDLLIPLLKPPF